MMEDDSIDLIGLVARTIIEHVPEDFECANPEFENDARLLAEKIISDLRISGCDMLGEIERLRAFEALARETGIF